MQNLINIIYRLLRILILLGFFIGINIALDTKEDAVENVLIAIGIFTAGWISVDYIFRGKINLEF